MLCPDQMTFQTQKRQYIRNEEGKMQDNCQIYQIIASSVININQFVPDE
jgi:hypothetical protein